jgi:hypothetical protein
MSLRSYRVCEQGDARGRNLSGSTRSIRLRCGAFSCRPGTLRRVGRRKGRAIRTFNSEVSDGALRLQRPC